MVPLDTEVAGPYRPSLDVRRLIATNRCMLRAFVLFLVLAVVAAAGTWWWYRQQQTIRASLESQIVELQSELAQLRSANDRLKSELSKVEDEQTRLATENQALIKALEQAKVTGKVPNLPYPPK
jgi:septal ring factor EnvC (AmiA/AmiB activator)